MPVILTTPFVPTAPVYDKVHLDHMTVTLEKTDYAKTQIQARIRLYKQDPETGVKTFSTETHDIFIEDAVVWATDKAMQNGDMRGIDAGNHITSIVALLVEICTNLGGATAT